MKGDFGPVYCSFLSFYVLENLYCYFNDSSCYTDL